MISQKLNPKEIPTWIPKQYREYPMFSGCEEDEIVFYFDGDYWLLREGAPFAMLAGWNAQ